MPMSAAPSLHASRGDWAQWYAAHGWPVFPCHGKAPVGRLVPHGWQDATTDLTVIQDWWRQWPAMNIGTPAGLTWWALDIDARHDGPDTLRDLEASYSPLPRTVTSLTGSGAGSQHQLWALGAGAVVNKAQLGDGLDVQGPGSYIILPPSIHPDTGKPYLWEADFGPDDLEPQAMPAWLEALVTATTPAPGTRTASPVSGGPIYEGTRETTLIALAGAMRRYGATEAEILAALEITNQRCVPPLEQKDLERMARSAGGWTPAPTLHVQTPPAPPGWSVNGVSSTAQAQTPAPGAWTIPPNQTGWWKERIDPYTNKSGKIAANNTTLMALLDFHPDWQGRLWWDDMASKLMLDAEEITEAGITQIGADFGVRYSLPIHSDALLLRCLLAICQQHKRDPLQEWLRSLPGWDMVPRLETWLLDCAGLVETAYHRFCSKILIVSMIARAIDPGCICRYVLILEGPEEFRKSTFVSSLVPRPEWCDELTGNLDNKEAHLMVQGLWVAELAELDSLPRTEETKLKSFISMRVDAHIPKFKSMRVRPLRRTIFVGTTNDSCYLSGTSGNTRFFPVTITQPMDIETFLAVREQLFAEAMVYYYDNPKQWWRMSAEAEEEAIVQRENRRQSLVIEDDFEQWLMTRRFVIAQQQIPPPDIMPVPNETSWAEIALGYYGLRERDKWTVQLQRQAAQALKTLGWKQDIVKRHGKTVRLWVYNPLLKVRVVT